MIMILAVTILLSDRLDFFGVTQLEFVQLLWSRDTVIHLLVIAWLDQ